MANETCPSCGMQKDEWPTPQGVRKDGQNYCCQGCADGTGCTCSMSENEGESAGVSTEAGDLGDNMGESSDVANKAGRIARGSPTSQKGKRSP